MADQTYNTAEEVDIEAVGNSIVANGAASVSVGGRTVTFISVNDLIAWKKFQLQQKAASNPESCLRFARMEGSTTRW